MKRVHALVAAAALTTLVSGAAMARGTYDSTGQNFNQTGPSFLIGITNPDPIIATAQVQDRFGRTIGAVQGVALDDRGHALRVDIALLHGERLITVPADRFLYDADSNVLTAPKGLHVRA